jgi:hypothetical protein
MRYQHPYDRGVAANFAEVFGNQPWFMWLLPSLRPPPLIVHKPLASSLANCADCASHAHSPRPPRSLADMEAGGESRGPQYEKNV